jgi:hypothetical protein
MHEVTAALVMLKDQNDVGICVAELMRANEETVVGQRER